MSDWVDGSWRERAEVAEAELRRRDEMSDRVRAEELLAETWRITNPNLASRAVDFALEFAAQEAERTKIDCTCDPVWAKYDKRDPQCEAHDLEDQQKRRASELRAQIGGKP